MTQRFDAIIIGGGPGGALAALLLSRQGWRTALVERRQRNQPKTCGHCLHPRSEPILQSVGVLDDVRRIARGESRVAHLYLPHRQPTQWSMSPGEHRPTMIVPRHSFDQLLIDRARDAGTCIRQPASAKILHLAPDDNHVRVLNDELRSPLIIGADGLRSTVARHAGLQSTHPPGRKYGFSFSMQCRNAAGLQANTTHMFITPRGYLGLVHHDCTTLHAAVLVSHAGDTPRQSPFDFIRWAATLHPSLRELSFDVLEASDVQHAVAAGPIPCHTRAVADARVALIGDAAGYVEPFTGEGMTWAMKAADVLASVTAQGAPGQWDSQSAELYSSRWQQGVARQQRLCKAMAWALHRPRVFGAMIAIASLQPRLTQRILHRMAAS